jgi:hypothetical protein
MTLRAGSGFGCESRKKAEISICEASSIFNSQRMSAPAALLGFGGVKFIDENGGGPGVRLRKRQQAKRSK